MDVEDNPTLLRDICPPKTMTRAIGAKLRYSSSSDIELLTAIHHDLQSDRDEGFSDNYVVENILSEILELSCSWAQNASREAGAYSGLPPVQDSAEDSVSDSEDETWVEEWDPEDLYKWILDELLGSRPLDSTVRRRDMRRRLEKRLALCERIPSFDAGTLPGVLNSLKEDIESAQEDTTFPCPISLLPVELLQDIFHLTRSFRRGIRMPLTLSRVSSHFRSVAIGTPSLWTTIDNVLPISIAELYITRSGEGPLHFCMSVDLLANTTSVQRNSWLDILSDSSGRIKCLEAYGCESVAFWQWTNILDDRGTVFSSLIRLELLVNESSQADYGGPNLNCPVWEWFPALQDLWIQGYPSEGWVGDFDPFPPGLRRLKFSKGRTIIFRSLLKALEGLTDLRTLSLDHCCLSTPPRDRNGITLTSLEELEVARMSTADIMAVASNIHTPNLTSLSVTYPVTSKGHQIAEVLIPFTKAHPQLRSLQIRECGITTNEWTSIMENLTNLKHLVIRASDLRDEDLGRLAMAPMVPNITHLTFDNELQLTTSLVEQVVRTHPQLVSVTLRGWNASHVSEVNVSVISGLVPYVQIQTFGNAESEADEGSDIEGYQWSDSYWEGSEFSEDDGWLSGDEAVRVQGK